MSRKPSFKTFRLCLLFFFVITVPFSLIHSHCASAQESADTLMKKAMEAGKARDFPGVVLFADQALKIDPQNKRAWLFKGHAYVNMGEERKAVSSFEHYLKLAPNDEKVKAYLAQLKAKVAKAEPEPAPKPEISPEQHLRNYAGHPNIKKTEAILKAVADRIMEIERSDPNPQKTLETTWKPHIDTLKNDLLPRFQEAARLCKAVTPETEQLREVHQAYLEAIEKAEAAMQDWVKAIEVKDPGLFKQGLAKAADGGARRQQALEMIEELAPQIASRKAPGSSQPLINVTGTYVAKNGEGTTLKQTGNRVTGTYQNGQSVIEGELSGTVLKGRFGYHRKVANTGALTFNFSEDGNSFKGKWVNGVNGTPNKGWADGGVLVKSTKGGSEDLASQAAEFIKSLGDTVIETALGKDRSLFMFNNQEQGSAEFNAQKGTYKGKECYHITLAVDGSLFGGKVTLKMEAEAYVLPDLTTLKSRSKMNMHLGKNKNE